MRSINNLTWHLHIHPQQMYETSCCPSPLYVSYLALTNIRDSLDLLLTLLAGFFSYYGVSHRYCYSVNTRWKAGKAFLSFSLCLFTLWPDYSTEPKFSSWSTTSPFYSFLLKFSRSLISNPSPIMTSNKLVSKWYRSVLLWKCWIYFSETFGKGCLVFLPLYLGSWDFRKTRLF